MIDLSSIKSELTVSGERPALRPPEVSRVELKAAIQALESLEREASETAALLRDLSDRLEVQITSLHDLKRLVSGPGHATPSVEVMGQMLRAQAPLRIYSLGPFAAYWGERQIALKRASKDATILKYLAAQRPQPVKRDVLLEVLWPDTDPGVSNNRLKVAMHHLRQAFSPNELVSENGDCILYEEGCYFFNPDVNVWTDARAFEENWQAGVKLERSGRESEAMSFFAQAEALYRGDFLEEDPLEEWTLVKRESLRDTYLEILDRLAHFWFRSNHVELAIMSWKKVIAKDPWREDAYRQLMICSAALGQRARALKWYETCAHTLRQQLGIEPEPDTVQLLERIRCGEPLSYPLAPESVS